MTERRRTEHWEIRNTSLSFVFVSELMNQRAAEGGRENRKCQLVCEAVCAVVCTDSRTPDEGHRVTVPCRGCHHQEVLETIHCQKNNCS